MMKNYNEDEYPWNMVDNIDAALFTGDVFHDKENLILLQNILGRWQTRVAEISEQLNEDESEE